MTKNFITAISIVALALFSSCSGTNGSGDSTQKSNTEKGDRTTKTAGTTPETDRYEYGFLVNDMIVKKDSVSKGRSLATVLNGLGINAQQIHQLSECPDSIFNETKVRLNESCTLLASKDGTPLHLIINAGERAYVTFDVADNMKATRHERTAEWRECEVAGRVSSSLWIAMEESNASPQLAVLMSHIFGWSIDFFGIQKGDEFRLIYSQEHIDGKPLNSYRIDAASFCASGNTVYAIPFTQEGEELFYNNDGNSLEGAFLKAPLDYYRISSKFSNSRYHPVLKRYRAHHGVDYAAPKGTPVYAIGSGKVIKKAYQANGAGYYLKIRHNSTYTTSYMHLSKYAAGLKEGDFVQQKQVIGYVGSTGLSTGPHLDFRVYENGKAIDPLTIKSQPKMPISEENKEAFAAVRDALVKRLAAIPLAVVKEKGEEELEEE